MNPISTESPCGLMSWTLGWSGQQPLPISWVGLGREKVGPRRAEAGEKKAYIRFRCFLPKQLISTYLFKDLPCIEPCAIHWGNMAPDFKEPTGHKTTTKREAGCSERIKECVVIQRGEK